MKSKLTILCLILALGLSVPALAAETLPVPSPEATPVSAAAQPFFPKVTELPAFTDLAPTAGPGGVWYDHQSVKITVEAGLMKGTGTAFVPGGAITLAEVATIAARINEKTAGYPIPAQALGETWYAPALAVMSHIGVDLGGDPLAKATRSDFVRILSMVLPDTMMTPINTITVLPDSTDPDVLRFYNAGLLQGKDAYGSFHGEGTLTRSEVAAMLARIISPDLRKLFTPAGLPPSPSPEPTATPSFPPDLAV